MVMHLVKEAFQKFANTVGLEPKPGSKDWWTQRAVRMEQELAAHEQQQEASLFTITSVNHNTDYSLDCPLRTNPIKNFRHPKTPLKLAQGSNLK